MVIAHVVAPRAEEEVAPAAEAVPAEGEAAAEPEVIKKGKADGGRREEADEKAEKAEKGEKKEKK